MVVELERRFSENDNEVLGCLASLISDDKPCDESFKKVAEKGNLDEELLKADRSHVLCHFKTKSGHANSSASELFKISETVKLYPLCQRCRNH